jgi:hypothetical protein
VKSFVTILSFCALILIGHFSAIGQPIPQILQVGYFGDTLTIESRTDLQVDLQKPVDEKAVKQFYNAISNTNFQGIVKSLITYKQDKQLDDWLFYQLIRRTAQQLSPKAENYERYTLYKWFLLIKCGYNAQLAFVNEKLLFYVQSDENIYDIPLFNLDGKQFVCLNIHDFGKIDFEKDKLIKVDISVPEAVHSFSYRVKQIPDFNIKEYNEKELVFNYEDRENRYKVKFNPSLEKMFNNYPSTDFETYFNIPLSRVTYGSLIPGLKEKLKDMKQEKGVDYLMNFTRHAFMFQTDQENFGTEKRLSPEQTLMNTKSDCDDRAALFYFLVKEIYNIPMIVLVYPSHVTIALELNQPIGTPVVYNGRKFSVCEPTPQRLELPVGQLMPELKSVAYQVVYEYLPQHK